MFRHHPPSFSDVHKVFRNSELSWIRNSQQDRSQTINRHCRITSPLYSLVNCRTNTIPSPLSEPACSHHSNLQASIPPFQMFRMSTIVINHLGKILMTTRLLGPQHNSGDILKTGFRCKNTECLQYRNCIKHKLLRLLCYCALHTA